MKVLFFALLFFITAGLLAQQTTLSVQTFSSTVKAADSIGTAIKINSNQLPSMIWTSDSLKSIGGTVAAYKYLKFYCFIGDTTGKSAITNWFLLSISDSGNTDYRAKLVKGKFIPLSPVAFYSFQVEPSTGKGYVYLRPYIPAGISKAIVIKLRTRNY
jgi:hypothetical protein